MKNYEIHFSLRYVKDGQHLHMLGQKMEDLIFTVADTNFFFNDLEDCDQVEWSHFKVEKNILLISVESNLRRNFLGNGSCETLAVQSAFSILRFWD